MCLYIYIYMCICIHRYTVTIVNGIYKPTYNWGAPSCRFPGFLTCTKGGAGKIGDRLTWPALQTAARRPAHLCKVWCLGHLSSDNQTFQCQMPYKWRLYLENPSINLEFGPLPPLIIGGYWMNWWTDWNNWRDGPSSHFPFSAAGSFCRVHNRCPLCINITPFAEPTRTTCFFTRNFK